MKAKVATILEYIWYAIVMHIVTTTYAYFTSGTIHSLSVIAFTLPFSAFCIYLSSYFFKRGVKELKNAFNQQP